MKHNNNEKSIGKLFLKLFLAIILFLIVAAGLLFAWKVAPNYINRDITDRTNLVLNFSNVTGRMKHDLIINDDGVVYLSVSDIRNYYDKNIYFDEQYNQIITSSEDKLAVFKIDENKVIINGKSTEIKGPAILSNDEYYLPISEMEDIYNVKVTKAENKIIIESLDRKLTTATLNKKAEVKYKTTAFSRTLDKLEKGDKVAISENNNETIKQGWKRVRTANGNIGYIEEKYLDTPKVEREDAQSEKIMDGKISLVWEYVSEITSAPDNTGKKYEGVNVVSPSFFRLRLSDTKKDALTYMDVALQAKIDDNVGDEGVEYIKWAHQNDYKVWAKVSNETLESTIDEFSYIINDYKLRDVMIQDILNYTEKYNLDGINIDYEYMYQKDKDAFSEFIIELAPQLRSKGKCLSVDVTAPDGGANWSLCYDRKLLGEVADYVVFMGYDQYGQTVIGTTSGYNWLKNNINKFLDANGQDYVPAEKLIIGLPFYTRLWQTKDGATISQSTVLMCNVNNAIPANSSKEWQDDVQQYYVQYDKGGYTYKMWVEDEESFTKKLELIQEYDVAGAGYWRKGFEPDSIWKVIKNKLEL